MTTRNAEIASNAPEQRRRPWTTPQIVMHESMMVLTQNFFGVPSAPTMLLGLAQISCVVSDVTPVC
jgi:hypothetical protein